MNGSGAAGAIDYVFAIDFRHTFPDPVAPVDAQDGVKGVFDNPVHPAVIGGISIRQFGLAGDVGGGTRGG